MENNKILITVQFTYDDKGRDVHRRIELYVLRDMTFGQLITGIKYGVQNRMQSAVDDAEKKEWLCCSNAFEDCVNSIARVGAATVYPKITVSSYNGANTGFQICNGRPVISTGDFDRPLYQLGFITSTKVIFDMDGKLARVNGPVTSDAIIPAFDPSNDPKISFPKYNISTRQHYRFNDEPISIIPPSDPPKAPENNFFAMLLPAIVTMGTMMIMRTFMSSDIVSTVLMSLMLGATTAVSTFMSWKRQKAAYAKSLNEWRTEYSLYIKKLIEDIRARQTDDVNKLEKLYPPISKLIGREGIESYNEHIFSRSYNDDDFLTVRLGRSNQVKNFFEIQGEGKDVVFSRAFYDIAYDNDKNVQSVTLQLPSEKTSTSENLCNLPKNVKNYHRFMKNAPLRYSLKNTSVLGIVDQGFNTANFGTSAEEFIFKTVFELCYYHSPEDLQFVVFYNSANKENIEKMYFDYKYMPHFRGLFDNKSQFAFDSASANLLFGGLLNILSERSANEGKKRPHIVAVVYEEYGIKEHALAEFFPKAPESDKEFVNELGITFVFPVKYKEYLPEYCNDVIYIQGSNGHLVPSDNIGNSQAFVADAFDGHVSISMAFHRFSSIYYDQIAQNGKVPSSVTMYEVLGCKTEGLKGLISDNWGIGSTQKRSNDITRSLRVPVGRTESETAYLDLHEKADGPHMLVAGTTGSGKSEVIISYLLQLCMTFKPSELNLLLVDMKGGGFTKRLGSLPHVVGTVTDVDGDENGTGSEYMLRRFLNAVKSEIKRRKILLNKLHVDSADAYIRACRDIESHIKTKNIPENERAEVRRCASEEHLSHLFLVVDEFTELKRFTSENNDIDFIGEITTIARIGRSLGFHIILISQNIEGAITDDIRVNSKARLCLKVATRQASKEMLGTDAAASPSMPGLGRAYLLVGTGSKFEYFQSAYSGAYITENDKSSAYEIVYASKTGEHTTFYKHCEEYNSELDRVRKALKEAGKLKTQLEMIVDAIRESGQSLDKREMPHEVFCKPLSSSIALSKDGRIVNVKIQKDKV